LRLKVRAARSERVATLNATATADGDGDGDGGGGGGGVGAAAVDVAAPAALPPTTLDELGDPDDDDAKRRRRRLARLRQIAHYDGGGDGAALDVKSGRREPHAPLHVRLGYDAGVVDDNDTVVVAGNADAKSVSSSSSPSSSSLSPNKRMTDGKLRRTFKSSSSPMQPATPVLSSPSSTSSLSSSSSSSSSSSPTGAVIARHDSLSPEAVVANPYLQSLNPSLSAASHLRDTTASAAANVPTPMQTVAATSSSSPPPASSLATTEPAASESASSPAAPSSLTAAELAVAVTSAAASHLRPRNYVPAGGGARAQREARKRARDAIRGGGGNALAAASVAHTSALAHATGTASPGRKAATALSAVLHKQTSKEAKASKRSGGGNGDGASAADSFFEAPADKLYDMI
jgi:hypothetical protein